MIEVDLKKIKHNAEVLVSLCKKYGIEVAGVTKSFCGHPDIARSFVEGGVKFLADSRIENLIRLKDIKIPKILLRLPMISEAEAVVEYADISLNSELETIKALSKASIERGITHKIILMFDLGDLREGYFKEEDLFKDIDKIMELEGIKIIGLGTNLTCYGGVIPKEDNLNRLVTLANKIKENYNLDLEFVSGGNSSSLHLLIDNKKVDGINLLRLGESIILGGETAFGNRIDNTYNDAFQLVVEIIEIKEKPSVPIGEIGRDAFGKVPTFVDKGIRKRIICAIGKQDIEFDSIIPIDEGISVLGGSSDHLILDGTDSRIDYKVGDKIRFKLTYGGILRAMTSEYVKKVMI